MSERSILFLRHLAPTSPQPLMLEVAHARDVFLYDPSGRRYFDLISGIAVSNVGHGNAAVLAALSEQLQQHLHVMVYGEYVLAPQVHFAAQLAGLLPEPLQSVYFTNSGSEAVEGALKLVKRLTGRFEIVSFHKSYHGSTQGALSILGDESLRNAFRPLIPGNRLLPFNDIRALQQITEQTAAVVVEPVQAEAGVVAADEAFMKALRQRCNDTGALLVLDECQTAFGRTGYLFCFQRYNLVPDVLILAKALGGGLPLGAFVSSAERMQVLSRQPALGHLTTFGGHPLSCAAGRAALDFLLQQQLVQQVPEKEQQFLKHLQHPLIQAVRSAGLLLAVDLGDPELCRNAVSACLQEGLALDTFLFAPQAIRIAPPLTITGEQIAEACSRFINALEKVT